MPNNKLTFKEAIEILSAVEDAIDYSYKEDDLYKYELLSKYDYKHVSNEKWIQYKYFNFPEIFLEDGTLRKKYPFSYLNGFDIIDVLNSLKYGLAVLHLDYNNKQFEDILTNLSDDIIYKVTSNFVPDEILEYASTILDSEGAFHFAWVMTVDGTFGNSSKDKDTSPLSENFFNSLSSTEQRVLLLVKCFTSKKANEWTWMYRNYIESGGETFLEFKESLGSLKYRNREEYLKKVQKQIGLDITGDL
jgi:hypothetical protein